MVYIVAWAREASCCGNSCQLFSESFFPLVAYAYVNALCESVEGTLRPLLFQCT